MRWFDIRRVASSERLESHFRIELLKGMDVFLEPVTLRFLPISFVLAAARLLG